MSTGSSDEDRAEFIISEIESSLSFVNVEFVVCTALLLFNTEKLLNAPMAGFALFAAFVYFLFGGLSFAVAGGEVARGPRGIRAARAALEWGNILSEWFGLYMLLLAIPIVLQLTVVNVVAGAVGTFITLTGYATYVLSGYDLLGRFLAGFWRIILHLAFVIGVVGNWLGTALAIPVLTYVFGGLFIALAVGCAIIHRLRGEFAGSAAA